MLTLVGTAVAFVVAYVTVAWMLRFVSRHTIRVFVWYRFALGRGAHRDAQHRLPDGHRDRDDPTRQPAGPGFRESRTARPARPARTAQTGPADRHRGAGPARPVHLNVAGTLAGRTPGVELDEQGREQADTLARRLREISIDRLVSSPLQRCRQTLAPLAAALDLPVEIDGEQLLEVDYGAWSERKLSELLHEPLWRVVQAHQIGRGVPAGRGPGRDVDPGGRRDPPHPAVGDP